MLCSVFDRDAKQKCRSCNGGIDISSHSTRQVLCLKGSCGDKQEQSFSDLLFHETFKMLSKSFSTF